MSDANPLPDQTLLLDRFNYDRDTGELTYREYPQGVAYGSPVGGVCSDGYARVMVNGKNYSFSRIIWRMMTGEDPGNYDIDHVDLDRLNNRWDNLRRANRSENNRNVLGRSACGFKGVYPANGNRWEAQIRVNSKLIHLGKRATKEEAACLYQEAADWYGGPFANCSHANDNVPFKAAA